ncbi:tryptophan-rich sensory protein [Patescibacteria group bacterium]|nr:tryptophan-rich sensory protein [Patescibacteria group bacterium]
MKKKRVLLLFGCLALPQLAGLAGALFTFSSVQTWYLEINRPTFTPPSWIFGPVWTPLYLLMGVGLYLVLVQDKPKKRAVTLFSLQLAFNVLWSALFFGSRMVGLAFMEILFLWLLVFLTLVSFWKVDKRAAWLLFPYLAWVSFATFLNYSFWLINQ